MTHMEKFGKHVILVAHMCLIQESTSLCNVFLSSPKTCHSEFLHGTVKTQYFVS